MSEKLYYVGISQNYIDNNETSKCFIRNKIFDVAESIDPHLKAKQLFKDFTGYNNLPDSALVCFELPYND